ncbi:hypothetical protein ECAE60S_03195 [Eoetvoesiella caeni]
MPDVGLEVVEFFAQNIIVELLQYTSVEQSLARQTMGSERGINHLSISVVSLDQALRDLSKKGFEAMPGFPRQGAHGHIAFMNTDSRLPARIELCQVDHGHTDEGGHHE